MPLLPVHVQVHTTDNTRVVPSLSTAGTAWLRVTDSPMDTGGITIFLPRNDRDGAEHILDRLETAIMELRTMLHDHGALTEDGV